MFFINLILGIVQGVSEFLPASSSGHLLIFQEIFKADNRLASSVILHIATIIAVILYFKKDLTSIIYGFLKKDASAIRLVIFIIIVTTFSGLIAICFKDFFEKLFNAANKLFISYFITAMVLFVTRYFMAGKKIANSLNFKDALILGIVQGIAIIPGISRAGITISTLCFLGLRREDAFKVSFLASIPAVFGALILEVKDVSTALNQNFLPLLTGFLAALISGLFALKILSSLINKGKFYLFSFYCFILSIFTFFYFK